MSHEVSSAVRLDLDAVFRSEYVRVVAVARRVLGSAADADDVAQEVFLSFARSCVPTDDAARWLTVAAAHTALNHLRSLRRREARELRHAGAADRRSTGTDPADEAERHDDQLRVRRALDRLPRQQALVLVLRHSGLSYAEIATATGLAVGGVGTTLRRAEAALRKELNDESSD